MNRDQTFRVATMNKSVPSIATTRFSVLPHKYRCVCVYQQAAVDVRIYADILTYAHDMCSVRSAAATGADYIVY